MPPSPFPFRPQLLAGYAVLVLAAAVYVCGFTVAASLPAGWLVLIGAALVLVILAPRFPQAALIAYLLLAGGIPRYGKAYETLLRSGALDWLCVLGLAGWALWCVRMRRVPPWNRYLASMMFAFMGWMGVAWLAAQGSGLRFQPDLWHHPVQFVHALALFLIASNTLSTEKESWAMALALCGVVALRAVLEESVYLETDATAWAALVLPLALVGVWHAPAVALRVAFGVAATGMLALLAAGQNRGAAVGLIAGLAVLLWHSKHKLKAVAGAAAVLLVLALAFSLGDYAKRFSVLWDSAAEHSTARLDRSTVEGRMDLWAGAWQLLRNHPLTGVGPGYYPQAIKAVDPRQGRLPVHNSVLHVAVETGVPGLALYLALFLGAAIVLARLPRAGPDAGLPPVARMLQAALVAYLATGMFISRHDMVLAYVLAGWALALQVAFGGRDARTAPVPRAGVPHRGGRFG